MSAGNEDVPTQPIEDVLSDHEDMDDDTESLYDDDLDALLSGVQEVQKISSQILTSLKSVQTLLATLTRTTTTRPTLECQETISQDSSDHRETLARSLSGLPNNWRICNGNINGTEFSPARSIFESGTMLKTKPSSK